MADEVLARLTAGQRPWGGRCGPRPGRWRCLRPAPGLTSSRCRSPPRWPRRFRARQGHADPGAELEERDMAQEVMRPCRCRT